MNTLPLVLAAGAICCAIVGNEVWMAFLMVLAGFNAMIDNYSKMRFWEKLVGKK